MLLTSSQISMGISSFIGKRSFRSPQRVPSTKSHSQRILVFAFTSLLFLSGYVLQQRTVRNLQRAIGPHYDDTSPSTFHPRPVENGPPLTFDDRPKSPGSGGGLLQSVLSIGGRKPPSGGWRSVAYVQIVREQVAVCNALMVFAALEKGGSRAGRVLLVPRHWVEDEADETPNEMDTTWRLLKTAVAELGVVLRPVAGEQGISPPSHGILGDFAHHAANPLR